MTTLWLSVAGSISTMVKLRKTLILLTCSALRNKKLSVAEFNFILLFNVCLYLFYVDAYLKLLFTPPPSPSSDKYHTMIILIFHLLLFILELVIVKWIFEGLLCMNFGPVGPVHISSWTFTTIKKIITTIIIRHALLIFMSTAKFVYFCFFIFSCEWN